MGAAEQIRDQVVNKLHILDRQVGQLEAEMEMLREVRDYAEHCIEMEAKSATPASTPAPGLITIGGVPVDKCRACGWLVAHDGCGKGCCRDDCCYSTRPSRYDFSGKPVGADE